MPAALLALVVSHSLGLCDEMLGQLIELIVENAGEKLPPELVSTLAAPFQHGTERVRSNQGGVGLGLTIVRSIVQGHDGILTIEGRPDGGLLVFAVVPAREGD